MDSLSYLEWCNWFAGKCFACKGAKRQIINGASKVCACQLRATVKYRFEQVDISPSYLRSKTWDDFTGIIIQAQKAVGSLSPASTIEAKRKAMEYCFDIPKDRDLDKEEDLDRENRLILHQRLKQGKNIIIAGERNSGRTLLTFLILKEVAHTSVYRSLDISFDLVPSSKIIDAARWDTSKTIDYDFLNESRGIDFLAIDGIDNFSEYGHTAPPDNIAMDSFFGYRKFEALPLIFVCSLKFLAGLSRGTGHAAVKRSWGEEFLALVTHPNNTVIQLRKDRHAS